MAGAERDPKDAEGQPGLWPDLRAWLKAHPEHLLGEHGLQRLGPVEAEGALFGARAPDVRSMALVRMALWNGARDAIVAFGSSDPDGFAPEMGSELIAFVTRVVERVADRWPVLDPAA